MTGLRVETIKLDAEIYATDQQEFPDQNPNAGHLGIYPQISALETIVYPTSAQIQQNIPFTGRPVPGAIFRSSFLKRFCTAGTSWLKTSALP